MGSSSHILIIMGNSHIRTTHQLLFMIFGNNATDFSQHSDWSRLSHCHQQMQTLKFFWYWIDSSCLLVIRNPNANWFLIIVSTEICNWNEYKRVWVWLIDSNSKSITSNIKLWKVTKVRTVHDMNKKKREKNEKENKHLLWTFVQSTWWTHSHNRM